MTTKRISEEGGCWPTAIQELLLRAALLEGQDCIEAWQTWKSCVDVQNLDLGSKRLFPLLYRNLQDHGLQDPLLPALKSAYRRTWRDNQLLFHEVSTLLTSLHARGIETIVLKGAALALLYYKDVGLRPMNDFDVMVPERQRSEAMAVMRDLGWRPMPRSPEALTEGYLSIVNGHGFEHASGRECDLHWHLLPECCQTGADDDFWEKAEPFEICRILTRSLAPADQLLHVCVHGVEWNPVPPLRWIVDSLMILKSANIDWNRLLAQAQKCRLVFQLKVTMNYLCAKFRAPVPAEILGSIQQMSVSKSEVREYNYKIQNYRLKPLGFIPMLWFRYRRLYGAQRPRHKLIGFARYVQQFWGAEHTSHALAFTALMPLRRVRLLAVNYKNQLLRS